MTYNTYKLRYVIAVLLAILLCIPTGSFALAQEELPEYYNRMSDEDFFGVWDSEEGIWTNEGAINYDYADELSLTEEYVKSGDYDSAKQALLYYYRNRSLMPQFNAGKLDSKNVRLSMNDILHFECNPIAFFNVSQGADWYSSDVTNTSDTFLITSFDKSEAISKIYSRESEFSPYLVVEQGDNVITLYPQKDIYVDCGLPDESFGSEEKMLVSDNGAGITDDTRQTYIRFDFNQTDRYHSIDKATLYLYAETEADNHELILFTSAEKSWTEEAYWNDVPFRVVSYRGTLDGYDWVRYDNSLGTYVDVNDRFLPMEPLISAYLYNQDEEYAKHGIRLTLDYIKDVGGLYYDPNPSVRSAALEAGFRGGNSLNSFFVFLQSPHMTAEASTSILKFLERECEGFAMEKYFDSYYNGGGYQTASFINLITYFPEFRYNEDWKTLIKTRIDRLSKDLVRGDGTYLEGTSGYADGVLGAFSTCIKQARIAGIELSNEFFERYRGFSRYIMGTATPLGKEPTWGDGSSANVRNRIYTCGEVLEDEEMLYFGSSGSEGTKPSYTSIFYPEGKLGVMRTGWETNDAYAFVIGRVGSSHSHTHTMAMEAYAYGRYLLTDTGMTSYSAIHPHFTWQRTRAAAHNTVEINETSPQAPFNESGINLSQTDMTINDTFDFFSGVTEGTVGYKHYRNIMFIKNRKMWLVSDYIYDMDGTVPVNHYTQNWHMLSDANPSIDSETLTGRSNYTTGPNIQVVPVKDENISARLADGVAMQPGANPRDTAEVQYIEISKDIGGDGSFDTVLFPTENTYDVVNISTERIPMPVEPEKASAYRIKADDDSFSGTYFITNETVPMERLFGAYSAETKNVYIETNSSGTETYICGTQIKSVKKLSDILIEASKSLTSVSASLSGGRAEVYTDDSFDIETDYIKLRAADAEKVYLNGEEVSFGRQGNLIVVGYCSEDMDSITTPGEDTEIPGKGSGSSKPVSSGGSSSSSDDSNEDNVDENEEKPADTEDTETQPEPR